MSDVLERKVWPTFAWISGGLFLSMLALIWAVSFVDSRWGGFLSVNLALLIAGTICTGGCVADGNTYRKRPRGWRKLRREAEREAYIRQLERELL